jgi:hypothetical protein
VVQKTKRYSQRGQCRSTSSASLASYLGRRTSKLNYINRNQVYVKTNSLLVLSAVLVIFGGITLSVAMDMSGSINKSMHRGHNAQVIGEVDDETLLDFDDPIEELLSNI